MSAEAYFEYYRRNGFHFSAALLSRYALALHAKPFVILSGISGTGKTKIALLFPEAYEAAVRGGAQPLAGQAVPAPVPGQPMARRQISLTLGESFFADPTTRLNLKDLPGFAGGPLWPHVLEPGLHEGVEAQIREALAPGAQSPGRNLCADQQITVVTPEGQELIARLYLQRASSVLTRLRPASTRAVPVANDLFPYLAAHFAPGQRVLLEKDAQRPARFHIVAEPAPAAPGVAVVGAPGPGQALQAAAPPAPDLHTEELARQWASAGGGRNKLFLSVGANWTDRSELFGYYNQIEGNYTTTAFLEFLQRAEDHPLVPHFLILDEMNLSKVEHYFADVLSCLESRVRTPTGMVQEPVVLHNRGELPPDNAQMAGVAGQMALPANLYITGTVNVDETTYMFSPKVLDRANVIEFNEVDLDLLETLGAPPPAAAAAGALVAPAGFALREMPDLGAAAPVTAEDYRLLPAPAKALLRALVQEMQPFSRHFGYRVAQEIARFVNSATAHVGAGPEVLDAALDAQLVQKVLPRFAGSQAELEPVLVALRACLVAQSPQAGDVRFPQAVAKLDRMLGDLAARGFTSFIG